MNERILKLREQAGLQPYYDAQEGQIEKFAELIVRECAAWIDEQPGWDGPYGHELLKFFGIEPL